MESDEFDAIWEKFHSLRPTLQIDTREPAADEVKLAHAEHCLTAVLPSQFKLFLKRYGGGHVGSSNIFSVNPGSDWYLIDKLAELSLPTWFLPISDDETGGFYGFLVKEGVCSDTLHYLDPDESGEPTLTDDSFYSYLARVGLELKS